MARRFFVFIVVGGSFLSASQEVMTPENKASLFCFYVKKIHKSVFEICPGLLKEQYPTVEACERDGMLVALHMLRDRERTGISRVERSLCDACQEKLELIDNGTIKTKPCSSSMASFASNLLCGSSSEESEGETDSGDSLDA